jgi:hypothetical protein
LISEKAEGTLVSDDDSSGRAGDSAHREYERRQARRVERARERYGSLGAFAANWIGDPATEAWRQGAAGEQRTARELAKHLRGSDAVLLHDRRVPGRGRVNIDHLAAGPAGVTVVDTRADAGTSSSLSACSLARSSWSSTGEIVRVRSTPSSGRCKASRNALERGGAHGIRVTGALCYPFMRRRWLHNSRARGGLIVVDQPRQIAKHTRRPGPLGPSEIGELIGTLDRAFPPAG